ncbi:hypothetical protein ACFPK1_01845 [Actinomycetospora rhizophila]|uniref:Uncharacterized protein n=1 Tax=Actinomycetospora rhizophila TaxID=1416876 RepID=A0ABV9Z702_9PSEU
MDDIVEEARVDWIDMGHAIGIVSLAEGGEDDLALLRRAGTLVARLVREGRLVPGDIGTRPGEFLSWPSSPDESARHLEYVDAVVSGTKPYEPWQPCMFAAVDGPTPS